MTIFNLLKIDFGKKINGWKEKILSQVGKEILIKNVAQVIPTYEYLVFSFPLISLDPSILWYVNSFRKVLRVIKKCVGKVGVFV